MRRTEVNLFLVAMAILPFLQNMLLNIGTGHYIHVCMYTVYMNFRQNFSQKKTFAISEKTLAETVHYIPNGLRKGNPFHGPFAQLSHSKKEFQINRHAGRSVTPERHGPYLAAMFDKKCHGNLVATYMASAQNHVHRQSCDLT